MYASSSWTRYRNGLSPVSEPEVLFPLMRPQMVSIDLPSAFFSARFISTSSTDDEFSIFAAMVGMAFFSRATAIGDAIALDDLASEGVTANPMYGYDRVLRSMK